MIENFCVSHVRSDLKPPPPTTRSQASGSCSKVRFFSSLPHLSFLVTMCPMRISVNLHYFCIYSQQPNPCCRSCRAAVTRRAGGSIPSPGKSDAWKVPKPPALCGLRGRFASSCTPLRGGVVVQNKRSFVQFFSHFFFFFVTLFCDLCLHVPPASQHLMRKRYPNYLCSTWPFFTH